jgi:hypothetical protein
MTFQQINVSDLTGEPMAVRQDIVTVAVLTHPDLSGGAAILDATLDELAGLSGEQNTTIELWFFDGKQVTMSVNSAAFDALATKRPMANILASSKCSRVVLWLDRWAFRRLAKKGHLHLPRPSN